MMSGAKYERTGGGRTPPDPGGMPPRPASSYRTPAAPRAAGSASNLIVRVCRELEASGAAILYDDAGEVHVLEAEGTLAPLRDRRCHERGGWGDRLLDRAPVAPTEYSAAVIPELPILVPTGAERLLSVPIPGDVRTALLVAAGAERRAFSAADRERAARFAEALEPVLRARLLEERVRRLERELDDLREARRRFFASASHELRTPLNAVLCYNALLADGVLGPLSDRQRFAVQRVSVAIRNLKRLIDQNFELTELESGKVATEVAPTDLHALALGVARELEPQARRQGVAIVVEGADPFDGRLETDPTMARRILLLLCETALTLTERKEITVRVRSDGATARVDVIDVGGGIRRQEAERIFEELAGNAMDASRIGLGLAIARRLAELLGGRITATAGAGAGMVLSLQIPARVVARA